MRPNARNVKTHLAPPTSHQYGFVRPVKPSYVAALGRSAGCSGCCGMVGSVGSFSPDMRSTEMDGASSAMKASSVSVGLAV